MTDISKRPVRPIVVSRQHGYEKYLENTVGMYADAYDARDYAHATLVTIAESDAETAKSDAARSETRARGAEARAERAEGLLLNQKALASALKQASDERDEARRQLETARDIAMRKTRELTDAQIDAGKLEDELTAARTLPESIPERPILPTAFDVSDARTRSHGQQWQAHADAQTAYIVALHLLLNEC